MRILIVFFGFALWCGTSIAQQTDSDLQQGDWCYIDGVKVNGRCCCCLDSISNIKIMTGLPVNYGDLNGPFIILKRKPKKHIAPLVKANL